MTMDYTGERPEMEGAPDNAPGEHTGAAEAPAVRTDDLTGLSAEDLVGKVRQAREDAQRNWQHFLHSAADLENYKKQAARDRQDVVERTRRQMLTLVLGVVDNVERALTFGEGKETGGSQSRSHAAKPLLEGLRMAHRQILDQLATIGVRPIDAVGRPFDPRLHEAVSVVAPAQAGQPAGTVAGEVLKGYLFNEDVLRPAKVTVVADQSGKADQPGKSDRPGT